MGGLIKRMPWTALCFLIGAAAISGCRRSTVSSPNGWCSSRSSAASTFRRRRSRDDADRGRHAGADQRPGRRRASSRRSASRFWPSRARAKRNTPTSRRSRCAWAWDAGAGLRGARPRALRRRSGPGRVWLASAACPILNRRSRSACRSHTRAALLACRRRCWRLALLIILGLIPLALRRCAPIALRWATRGAAGGSGRRRGWSTPPPRSPSRCGESSRSSIARRRT